MADSPDQTHRDPRAHMLVRATMTSDRIGARSITVRNLSPFGIGARAREQTPSIGEYVMINFEGVGQVGGTVRWVQGQQFGVALANKLDAACLSFATAWRDAPSSKPQPFVCDRYRPVKKAWRPGLTKW